MMEIVKNLCPKEKYSIKCPYERTATRIVIHNTANDAPAENEISYMLSNDNEVSYHFAVDDKRAIQGLPLHRNAWASGDGHGVGNMEGIHIEICYSLSGGERFAKAEENAARLTARLMHEYGWSIDRVTKHQDYDGKYCPHRTLDLGWQRFLDMVQKFYKEDEVVTYEQWKEFQTKYEQEQAKKAASNWAKDAIAHAQTVGTMTGDSDGRFRPQSTLTRQELAQALYNFIGKGEAAHTWAESAWQQAVASGIFDGTNPRAPVTREQLAVVLGKLELLPNAQPDEG